MIEPALSAEEWANEEAGVVAITRDGFTRDGLSRSGYQLTAESTVKIQVGDHEDFGRTEIPGLIALANAALPDSDPRKITREKIKALRAGAESLEADYDCGGNHEALVTSVKELVAALESYLPPEGA
jgi:hypothetical protein